MKTVMYSTYALVIVMFVSLILVVRKSYNEQNTIRKLNAAIINIEETFNAEEETVSKYNFVDVRKAVYIEQLSIELGLDPDLSFAILMVENPEFDEYAIHKNENGTIDVGYFQMNDKYFWTTFRELYWDFENVEPDPFNWKHNCYIALHHLKYLQDKLKLTDDVIMAYNGGISAVMNNNVRPSTYAYLAKVKNNMWLLKKGE